MVKYDSSTHELSLNKKFLLSDGSTPIDLTGKLNLDGIDEMERQRLIAVAKLITNWCSGHKVDEVLSSKQAGKEVNSISQLQKVNSLLGKTNNESQASDSSETQKEDNSEE